MNRGRKTSIKKAVDSIVQSDDYNPHVIFDDLLRRLSVKLVEAVFEQDFWGASLLQNDKKVIIINTRVSKHELRKRFTIAHELGHLILHENRVLNFSATGRSILFRDAKSSRGVDDLEIEANHFAACLLMPEENMEDDLAQLGSITEDAIDTLAGKYQVSIPAVVTRLTSLGYV
jgi:Zn-dependent peptidase ImmA (M78 family)